MVQETEALPNEEAILAEVQRLDGLAYERFLAGELSAEELQTVYSALRDWLNIWANTNGMLGQKCLQVSTKNCVQLCTE